MANYFDPKAYAKLPGRSKFDLSYRNSFTTKMGQLVPVVCQDVVPGDRFRCGLTYQMQLAPMLNPVYDGLEVNFESFFVPNRILDERWREFWTGYNEYDQNTPVDIAPLTLRLSVRSNNTNIADGMLKNWKRDDNPPIGASSLLDFLGFQYGKLNENGLPANVWKDTGYTNDAYTVFTPRFNAYPILAYNRIWDDWYRNERTQPGSLKEYYNGFYAGAERSLEADYIYDAIEKEYNLSTSGLGLHIPCRLHYRNYKKDPYTTALPEPIVGGDVRIPVGEDFATMAQMFPGSSTTDVVNASTGAIQGVVRNAKKSTVDGISLNALALGTIQQLKLALKEYSYRMKDTYNGNRYVESLYAHYGVVVPDSTLQRSIYLGSGRDYVNFGEVYQTSSGDGEGSNGALGDYAGRGAGNGTHYLFDESFYECGFFFVLMSVTPRSRYFQGIKRFFTRYDRADYFSPEYQNIGDDFISSSELFNDKLYSADSLSEEAIFDDKVFGYNSRWLDLKFRYDELHGDFANPSSPMFNWNFARSFDSAPIISPEFSAIRPINKPFVSLSDREDNYFVDVAVKLDALRPVLAVESF